MAPTTASSASSGTLTPSWQLTDSSLGSYPIGKMPCHYPIQGCVGGEGVGTFQEDTVRIVIVGGGASGIGATGAAEQTNPDAEVVMFTAFEDVAYSPCGIPYVHGRDIDSFDALFLQTKQFYLDRGITIHYETMVTAV